MIRQYDALPLPANHAEEDANAQETRLDALCFSLTEASLVPMVATDGPTHIVRYANSSFCRLSDISREELVGKPFAEVIQESKCRACFDIIERVYQTGEAENVIEQEQSLANADPVYWSYAAWAVLDSASRAAGVIVQVTDTTEAALLRQRLVALNEELLIASVKEHEQRELAYDMNVRLQRAIQETHHRVKNNLQAVVALADMQTQGTGTMIPAEALQRVIMHVRTLANIHELLTSQIRLTGDSETLSTQHTLHRLISLLQASSGDRRIHLEADPLRLSIGKCVSLSLLVNELVTNSLKHGAGDILVKLESAPDMLRLSVRDEGEGFADNFNLSRDASTGLELVETLVRHDMGGTVIFGNDHEGGANVIVMFPIQCRCDGLD